MLNPNFVLILIVLFHSLMFHEITVEATSRLSSKERCGSSGIQCHDRVRELHNKAIGMQDYGQGDEAPPQPAGDDYDYDSYRKHGDIPSPGVGH